MQCLKTWKDDVVAGFWRKDAARWPWMVRDFYRGQWCLAVIEPKLKDGTTYTFLANCSSPTYYLQTTMQRLGTRSRNCMKLLAWFSSSLVYSSLALVRDYSWAERALGGWRGILKWRGNRGKSVQSNEVRRTGFNRLRNCRPWGFAWAIKGRKRDERDGSVLSEP